MNGNNVETNKPKAKEKIEIPKKIKIFFLKKLNKYKEREKQTPKFLCKKTFNSIFKIKNFNVQNNIRLNDGRWSKEEHDSFLEGLVLYGTKWKNLYKLIKTRSLNQIRSHSQKFFIKMKLCKDENLNIDFTLDSIKSVKDMINQIKSKNNNYNIINILNYLNNK